MQAQEEVFHVGPRAWSAPPSWCPLAGYLGGCVAAGMTEGFHRNVYKHLASGL